MNKESSQIYILVIKGLKCWLSYLVLSTVLTSYKGGRLSDYHWGTTELGLVLQSST